MIGGDAPSPARGPRIAVERRDHWSVPVTLEDGRPTNVDMTLRVDAVGQRLTASIEVPDSPDTRLEITRSADGSGHGWAVSFKPSAKLGTNLEWVLADGSRVMMPLDAWLNQELVREALEAVGHRLPEFSPAEWVELVATMVDASEEAPR